MTRLGTLTPSRICRGSWWAALVCIACEPAIPAPVLDLPQRQVGSASGTEIADSARTLGLDAREELIFAEVARGNVPTWLRHLRQVELTGEVKGQEHQVVFWVTPDYVAVGSESDYLLVPLSPQMAQRIADLLGASLPTPRMVDAVWKSARVRLAPQRIQPQDSVESTRTVEHIVRHNSVIQGQRTLRRVAPDDFVAGHKKDIVLSVTLSANPGKVAVYGWHRPDGTPNQTLSTVATDSLVYYSHGVRLVHNRILVDGVSRDLTTVLRDPELAPLLSDAGAMAEARYPLERGDS